MDIQVGYSSREKNLTYMMKFFITEPKQGDLQMKIYVESTRITFFSFQNRITP